MHGIANVAGSYGGQHLASTCWRYPPVPSARTEGGNFGHGVEYPGFMVGNLGRSVPDADRDSSNIPCQPGMARNSWNHGHAGNIHLRSFGTASPTSATSAGPRSSYDESSEDYQRIVCPVQPIRSVDGRG